MNDTPRTDAATITLPWKAMRCYNSITYVTVDFARELERELSEAIRVAEKLAGAAEHIGFVSCEQPSVIHAAEQALDELKRFKSKTGPASPDAGRLNPNTFA